MGLVRPSDITMRNLLVGETMPADYLMRAMGVSRTPRRFCPHRRGAVRGRALVAVRRSGLAYVAVCAVYAVCFSLTFGVGIRRLRVVSDGETMPTALGARDRASPTCGSTPVVRAVMLLAFLVNFAAYPLTGSLPRQFAKDVYGMNQTGWAG